MNVMNCPATVSSPHSNFKNNRPQVYPFSSGRRLQGQKEVIGYAFVRRIRVRFFVNINKDPGMGAYALQVTVEKSGDMALVRIDRHEPVA